jgi:starvation-inducible DNA-binding protein
MMDELQKAAKVGFASTFSFYLKAHNFHWNVVGNDFEQYHGLFGKIYEEVYGTVDNFAENIRKLGTFVPGSYTRFSMLTQIDDETEILPLDQMKSELLADNEKMIGILKLIYQLSEQNQEYGFSNYLAERIDAHRKHGWMLTASSQG